MTDGNDGYTVEFVVKAATFRNDKEENVFDVKFKYPEDKNFNVGDEIELDFLNLKEPILQVDDDEKILTIKPYLEYGYTALPDPDDNSIEFYCSNGCYYLQKLEQKLKENGCEVIRANGYITALNTGEKNLD
tara:strand:- start:293 stop:688 length:396 start_codon:yes stop_codon:yes gene_type:complete